MQVCIYINTTLYTLLLLCIIYSPAPSSVQNTLVTLVGDMINITWSPPSISNGKILQYIVKRVNSSGRSYHYISRDQNYLELPYFNDALVFVAVVNQYGQSSFEQANSSGKKKSLKYNALVHSLYSPINSSLSTISLY